MKQFILSLSMYLLLHGAAFAEIVGSVDTDFRLIGPDNKITVEAFEDEDVTGVVCYISRAVTGGIKGAVGVAEDRADASLSCRQNGPILLSDAIKAGKEDGQQVFKKRTSLIFKSIQVVRFYDKKHNSLVYLVYSDRVITGSPKNSVSAVAIMPWPVQPLTLPLVAPPMPKVVKPIK